MSAAMTKDKFQEGPGEKGLEVCLEGVKKAVKEEVKEEVIEDVLMVDSHLKRENLNRSPIKVAVGVLQNAAGSFLLASRPVGKAYAGYWEFPGGKFEFGETGQEALVRELKEELGINITAQQARLWRIQKVDYPHALVELHFFRVQNFEGTPQTLEGQAVAWSELPVKVSPVLPGAMPVLDWLALDQGFKGSTV